MKTAKRLRRLTVMVAVVAASMFALAATAPAANAEGEYVTLLAVDGAWFKGLLRDADGDGDPDGIEIEVKGGDGISVEHLPVPHDADTDRIGEVRVGEEGHGIICLYNTCVDLVDGIAEGLWVPFSDAYDDGGGDGGGDLGAGDYTVAYNEWGELGFVESEPGC